ncbi:MAG: DUF938 domain-containing protein [Pseudomonadota bacterium]
MSESGSGLFPENGPDAQRHAPATLRNRDAIVAVLREILPASGTILEVASGTGEHAVYFGRAFPHLTFQPSDPDLENHRSIRAWTEREDLPNILPPLALDALHPEWDIAEPAAILCINMVHIAPWEASIGLFEKASRLLKPGAPFYLYGPYFQADEPPAEGNLAFERSLKSRNLQWGIRDVADMNALAAKTGFRRESLIDMPANNISLIYRRD